MSHELYKKYRPKTLDRIVGQNEAVRVLQQYLDDDTLPHALLIQGPSGCGKTTIARILRNEMEVHYQDYQEINAADHRGIDVAREVRSQAGLSAIAGHCRMWVVDEAHQLTGEAQSAFLKLWEDTPDHVYFILCTTDPQKLKPTIRTRCTPITVKLLNRESMKLLLLHVLSAEKTEVGERVENRIIDLAEGSPRKALVLLDSVIGLGMEKERLKALQNVEEGGKAIDLARALFDHKATWTAVARLLKDLDEDPETVRWVVLGYARSVLLGGKGGERAHEVIEAFRDNFYDCKHAGLAAACWEIFHD